MQIPTNLLAPALVIGVLLATGAQAQTPQRLAIEVRGGTMVPTGDFDNGVAMGWSVGGTLLYSATPSLELYAGFEHADFPLDGGAETGAVKVRFADDGLRTGARYTFTLADSSSIRPWTEVGMIFNRTTVRGTDGETSASIHSNWLAGFEVGVGFTYPLFRRLQLMPGVRYRDHLVRFEEFGEAESTVSYVAVDFGLNLRL